jgi:single-stranded-DNA-specific exonuclease
VTEPTLQIPPAPVAQALALADELGVSPVVAQVLVRRRLADPDRARAFLDADERHSPEAFAGIDTAVSLVRDHIAAADRITVHGDYDVDGVCSTAVLVRALRRLGATVDWYLPDRLADGYGLNEGTVRRLAERGTRLLITADCAVAAVEEVAAARAAGIDVVVTDHHATRADGVLPAAPIVHPAVCGYPCPDLCATAVAHQFARALLRAAGEDDSVLAEDLDLVALATIADVVPLLGENRTLVREGLRALAVTAKPGLRALMAVAGVDPARVDERAIGFALCPRLNAAGRLQRADAALELILTEDPERAAAVADELDRANHERRHTETRILFEAEAQIAESGERSAYVVQGEDWHPGVIGIVASRLVERHHRPVVCVALTPDGGRGSGRAIDGFDLLGGLRACAGHLRRFGGHRAAAGLEIDRAEVAAFAAAFERHADAVLTEAELAPKLRVDAVVAGDELGLSLAEELRGLGPFGRGNPPISLLLAAAGVHDQRPMGEGRHVRFTLSAGGSRSQAVAFGNGGRLAVEEDAPVDAVCALEVNEFRGVVEPRLVLRHARPSAPPPVRPLLDLDDYLAEVWRELAAAPPGAGPPAPERRRRICDRRGRGLAGTLSALVGSGEAVLVVAADARRRRDHLRDRLGGFALTDYRSLERDPALTAAYDHVALLDPPPYAAAAAAATAGDPAAHAHLCWGPPEVDFARQVLTRDLDLRVPAAACYRALRAAGPCEGERLERLLAELAPPTVAGRLLRVLGELELITVDPGAAAVALADAPARTDLERSPTFVGAHRALEEGLRALSEPPRGATRRAA